MDSTNKTLKNLLDSGKRFVIPTYQRGYIWGKSRNSQKNSVEHMLDSIFLHMQGRKDLFIQGITVCETDSAIEMIDGQQRITFLYLLLKYLDSDVPIQLDYPARKESETFLHLNDPDWKNLSEDESERFQDIYFFKKTIRLIRERRQSEQQFSDDAILCFVLNRIKFLYIELNKENAISVFTMMNGNKANMRPDEIVKAELLRLVSQETDIDEESPDRYVIQWEQNLLRSKYAREWDKWLYWWNRDEVKTFYHTENGMDLLLKIYFAANTSTESPNKEVFNFENFRIRFLQIERNVKKTFYELRCMQKRFEDVYNVFDKQSAERHNRVGAILTLLSGEDRERFMIEYFGSDDIFELNTYYKYVFLGLSHADILSAINGQTDKDIDIDGRKQILLRQMSRDDLYFSDGKEQVFRQLLRRNIEEDSKLGRAFDFSIWKYRSLEHVFPKSQVYYQDEDGNYNSMDENDKIVSLNKDQLTNMLNRRDFCDNGSEHCIGNLVLLHKNDNSKFGAKSFDEKKAIYFDMSSGFGSRHLLHSISVFTHKGWGVTEIQDNKKEIINEIKTYYEIHESR